MDKLGMMQTFISIVEEGSFTKAGIRLNKTKSLLSNRVKSLENELGIRLINRSTKSISITSKGYDYYNQCKLFVDQLESMENEFKGPDSEMAGSLRITSPQCFGNFFVLPAVCSLMKDNPDLNIEVSLSDDYVDLVYGGYDAAFRIGILQDSELIARTLGELETVLVASPGFLKQRPQITKLSDLASIDCIFDSNLRRGQCWILAKDGVDYSIKVKARLIVNNASAAKTAALNGLGVTQIPAPLVEQEIAENKLQQVLGDYQQDRFPIQVVYPHRKYLSKKVRLFIDYLSEQLNNSSSVIHC